MSEKFLMLSGAGEGYALALRLKQAGHTVKVHAHDQRARFNYDGLLEKADRWEDYLDRQTIVLFDSTGGGKTADRLKQRGHHVWGGSLFADQLEFDRGLAFELLDQVGVKTPETKTFYEWEAGRAHAKRVGGRLVFKASGKLAHDTHVRTYCSCDPDDMVGMLTYYEQISTQPPEFELQEYRKGLVLSTEGWFNGEDFMLPFNHTLEHKGMHNDDLGPSTGCAFDVVFRTDLNHVVEEGLAKMAPLLREYGHVGLVDLNTVVDSQGVWALEFTPRMGYDSFATLCELFEGNDEELGDLIAQMARGETPESLPLKGGFASSLRITVPPHPTESARVHGGLPIRGFEKADRPHLWFFDVQLDPQGQLVSTPAYGNIVCCTGYGQTIQVAFEGPTELAQRAKIPEKQYRTDATARLYEDWREFEERVESRRNQMKEVGGVSGD